MLAASDFLDLAAIGTANISRMARRQFDASLIVGLVVIMIAGMIAATPKSAQRIAVPGSRSNRAMTQFGVPAPPTRARPSSQAIVDVSGRDY